MIGEALVEIGLPVAIDVQNRRVVADLAGEVETDEHVLVDGEDRVVGHRDERTNLDVVLLRERSQLVEAGVQIGERRRRR